MFLTLYTIFSPTFPPQYQLLITMFLLKKDKCSNYTYA